MAIKLFHTVASVCELDDRQLTTTSAKESELEIARLQFYRMHRISSS